MIYRVVFKFRSKGKIILSNSSLNFRIRIEGVFFIIKSRAFERFKVFTEGIVVLTKNGCLKPDTQKII